MPPPVPEQFPDRLLIGSSGSIRATTARTAEASGWVRQFSVRRGSDRLSLNLFTVFLTP
jgi:hypothetical protein